MIIGDGFSTERSNRLTEYFEWKDNIRNHKRKENFHNIIENVGVCGVKMWGLTRKLTDKVQIVKLDFMRWVREKQSRRRSGEEWKQRVQSQKPWSA